MLDIPSEMIPDNTANRIFINVSHPLVDVVEDDSIYREIMRYPTQINSLSAWYFNEFQNLQWTRKWQWKRRWRDGKQVVVMRKIDDGRVYIYR